MLFCVFPKKLLTNMQFRAAILLSALMPHIRFHDLRQSCATLLFAQGVPMKEIQAWLGHSTIGTTANIYTHLDENSKINSANAIIGILEQKRTLRAFHLRVSAPKMVPPTGIEPVRFLGRGILSAKTHSERGGIRLHKSESISYASSGVFLIFQSFSLKKFSYSPVFRISFRIAWSINLTRFSSLWRDVWRDADRSRPERRRLNEKQKVL